MQKRNAAEMNVSINTGPGDRPRWLCVFILLFAVTVVWPAVGSSASGTTRSSGCKRDAPGGAGLDGGVGDGQSERICRGQGGDELGVRAREGRSEQGEGGEQGTSRWAAVPDT